MGRMAARSGLGLCRVRTQYFRIHFSRWFGTTIWISRCGRETWFACTSGANGITMAVIWDAPFQFLAIMTTRNENFGTSLLPRTKPAQNCYELESAQTWFLMPGEKNW